MLKKLIREEEEQLAHLRVNMRSHYVVEHNLTRC